MGAAYDKLGQHGRAEEAFQHGISLVVKLTTEFPRVRDYRQELARSYRELAELQMYTNRLGEAEKSFGECLSIDEQLAADFGADNDLRRDLAWDRHELGCVQSGILGGVPRPKEAQQAFRQALDLYRRLV